MVGNKLEQSIISVFQDDLSSTHSINQVSKSLKKSYPIINRKSNLFLNEGILNKIVIGKSYQCFLNMRNEKTRVLMALNEIGRKELFLSKNKNFSVVLDELNQIALKFPIDAIVLYKKSLIFVTEKVSIKHDVQELSFLTKEYNMLFLDRDSFREQFSKDKDLQKYHLVLYNVDLYVNMIAQVSGNILADGLIKPVGKNVEKVDAKKNG